MDEMNQTTTVDVSAEEEYSKVIMPKVHKIGRITMLISLILVFSPVVYYILIGYSLPLPMYIGGAVGIVSACFGMWISEPTAVWPVLGSAGTYMAYLAGDVSGTRVPVAIACQKNANADINTPKGQVITIVGIVASVFTKLVVLTINVSVGTWIISKLPPVVIASFAFIMAACMGALLLLNIYGKKGIVKGAVEALPYIGVAFVVWFLINKVVPIDLSSWSMLAVVGSCVIVAYILYRRDLKNAENEGGAQ